MTRFAFIAALFFGIAACDDVCGTASDSGAQVVDGGENNDGGNQD